jgi:hypothetical protein
MVFNDTFNNISVISWWSVLLVEKLSQVTHKLYHIMLYRVQCLMKEPIFPMCTVDDGQRKYLFFHLLRYINEYYHVNI